MKKFDEKFKTWETKKRKEMGDYQFLDKYSKRYKKLDKLNKVIFLIASSIFLFLAIFDLALFVNLKIVFWDLIKSILLSVSVIFITQMYYFHASYAIYGQQIERWKKELENIKN